MTINKTLTKILAIFGTILIWLPILAPALLCIASFIKERVFRFDYLLPAEVFPIVLIGSCLLVWAAWKARYHLRLIGWSITSAIVILLIGQGVASVTGLASGEIEPDGWQWALVLASLALYWVGLIVVGIGGILLLRDLFKQVE